MIEEITLRGLGVIQAAVLEPHAGFTAVTGETGAGKTMVLTALGLLLGGRAEGARVRHGDSRTEVEGRFRVAADSEARVRVTDAGGELDRDTLLLARTVSAEGRSKAYAGGRSVPAGVLADLSDLLVAVHGQSDQRRLLQPGRQRDALDRYGAASVATPLVAYREVWDRLHTVEREFAQLSTQARERAREADQLRFGIAEVEAAAPVAREDERLRAESGRLVHTEALRDAVLDAHEALSGEDDDAAGTASARALVARARRSLEGERVHDEDLAALADRVGELAALVGDISGDLAAYLASVEADPARLVVVQERRALLSSLTRKYGATVADVLAWADDARSRLEELQDDDERIGALDAERTELTKALQYQGSELTAARREAAGRLSHAVTVELVELAMPHAEVIVEVATGVAAGAYGYDDVEMRLAPHVGAAALPLASAASGGELSRVMLALEVAFAGSDPVPTMVFDEVDAGVGGKAAIEIGRRLARLSATTQVIVVTHLPQVAAFADRQVVVEKSDDGTVTTSGLRVVEGDERTRELARMLAGLESSEAAGSHAKELLALAATDRRKTRRRATTG